MRYGSSASGALIVGIAIGSILWIAYTAARAVCDAIIWIFSR